MKKKIETELTRFPCPTCGKYYIPYMSKKDGKALLECEEHGLYETSIAVSKNFRKFCSRIARKPNRSPIYFTSVEGKLRNILDELDLIEGLDYFHNSRIGFTNTNKRKVYYWLDFVIPAFKLIIECSPVVWHKLWRREISDKRKQELIEQLGWKYISLNEKEINKNKLLEIFKRKLEE